jgi:putative hemolysin
MLVDFIVIGVALIVIGACVSVEVAVSRGRARALAGWTDIDSGPYDPSLVRVSDFVVFSRIAIAACIIAITLCAVRAWNSVLGEALEPLVPGGAAKQAILVALGVPLFVLILGLSYVIPARLAERFPNQILRVLSATARRCTRLVRPLVAVVQGIGELVVPPAAEAEELGEEEIEADIKSLVAEGEKAGVIEEEEREIITRVFKLGDKPVLSVMTPRSDVIFVAASSTPEQALPAAVESRLTWFPVVGEAEDEVLGIVSIHDLLSTARLGTSSVVTLRELVQPAIEVPESMTALELLEEFREKKTHFAIIRDEYGSVCGVATVDDVLGVIVGEIGDSDGDGRSIVRRDDGSLLVDAASDIQNLFETLELQDHSGASEGQFHSVGGFIMTSLGRIPRVGDSFLYDGHRFEVVDMDGKRIDKVLVVKQINKEAVGQQ